jgi:hypothetical protein
MFRLNTFKPSRSTRLDRTALSHTMRFLLRPLKWYKIEPWETIKQQTLTGEVADPHPPSASIRLSATHFMSPIARSIAAGNAAAMRLAR